MLRFVYAVLNVLFPATTGNLRRIEDTSNGKKEEEEGHGGWFEEELDDGLKLSFALNSELHKGKTAYQDIALLDTKIFGKVLVIDGMLQSAEVDEFIYHECLVHPALLLHENPRRVFIMGGGEGSTAREALKHKCVEKVVMCDIDKEVVEFCSEYLSANYDSFLDPKLQVVINDAREELEKNDEKYDVIVGDLADPVEKGPCWQLYTKSFYEQVIKPKLNNGGIFVTQSGLAGVLSHKQVYTSIYNTLRNVFTHVIPYSAHIPSYADTTGWIMASDQPLVLDADLLDRKIKERVGNNLAYLDGSTIVATTVLNKVVRTSLLNETHIITEENARFAHGHGLGADA